MANADCPCVPRGRSSFSDQGIPWASPPSEAAGVGLRSSPWEGACVRWKLHTAGILGLPFRPGSSCQWPCLRAVAFATVIFSLHSCLLPASPFCISPSDPVSTQPSVTVFRQDRESSTQDFQSSPWTTESGPQSVAYFQAFPSASKCAA